MPPTAVLRAALLLFAAAPVLRAQSGLVRGSVSDDAGQPLPVVRVSIVGTTLSTESRADGTFELRGVPVGTRTVRAQRFGYRAGTMMLDVRAAEAAVARFALHADPLALEGVVVSGTFNPASKLESSTAIMVPEPLTKPK